MVVNTHENVGAVRAIAQSAAHVGTAGAVIGGYVGSPLGPVGAAVGAVVGAAVSGGSAGLMTAYGMFGRRAKSSAGANANAEQQFSRAGMQASLSSTGHSADEEKK